MVTTAQLSKTLEGRNKRYMNSIGHSTSNTWLDIRESRISENEIRDSQCLVGIVLLVEIDSTAAMLYEKLFSNCTYLIVIWFLRRKSQRWMKSEELTWCSWTKKKSCYWEELNELQKQLRSELLFQQQTGNFLLTFAAYSILCRKYVILVDFAYILI
jgi:hypothetical protein